MCTSCLRVLLRSRPAIQSVSRLLPSQHAVVSGHGVSVVNVFIVVILQRPQPERLQVDHTVTTPFLFKQTSSSTPQKAHLPGHAAPPCTSPCISEQLTPRLRLRVEQVDVIRGSSAQQCHPRVQTPVPQTLNTLLGVEVHWSHILWGKGQVLWGKLFITIILLSHRQITKVMRK